MAKKRGARVDPTLNVAFVHPDLGLGGKILRAIGS